MHWRFQWQFSLRSFLRLLNLFFCQSAAGWDWIAPAPDRNTGPWGNVLLAATFVQDSSGTSADTSADSDVAAQLQKSQNSLRGNELPQIDAKSGLIEDVVNESNVELR
jgi:hypothetical protein